MAVPECLSLSLSLSLRAARSSAASHPRRPSDNPKSPRARVLERAQPRKSLRLTDHAPTGRRASYTPPEVDDEDEDGGQEAPGSALALALALSLMQDLSCLNAGTGTGTDVYP